MIPKIIHYCWFGGKELPEDVKGYIATWRKCMPEWEIMEWSESNSELDKAPQYVKEAYAAKKWAFVSDYVRLWALKQYGGVYFDTDVEVLKSFEPLLGDTVFIGFEESKAKLPATCMMACEADCTWVNDMIALYDGISFLNADGSYNMFTNVQRMGARMVDGGLVPDGKEQYLKEWGARVYPFDYFSPLTSTRVLRVSENTYSIHHFASSWHDAPSMKGKIIGFICDKVLGRELADKLIQLKRKLLCK